MAKRMTPNDRQAEIMAAALAVAEAGNYRYMTREEIAAAADCSPGLISMHFGTMEQVRDEVMRVAIETRRPKIILQGLVAQDTRAQLAPGWLRAKALESVA